MKKILCPMDFGEPALNAFVYALVLARAMKARIVTMGAYRLPHHIYNDEAQYPDLGQWTEFEAYRDELPGLDVVIDRYNARDIPISHRLDSGAVAPAILVAAREERPDIIVMGTSRASGVAAHLFGTTTQKIMSEACAPVLAIPHDYQYQTVKKILFLTRFDKKHYDSLKKLEAIASLFSAGIEVVQIDAKDEGDLKSAISGWRCEFPQSSINFTEVAMQPTAANVTALAQEAKAGWIAIETHPDCGSGVCCGILSRQLLADCAFPLLSIPVPEP